MTYSMTCTCGDVMSVEAASRDEAVTKMQAMMSKEAIAKHMAEKHPAEAVWSKAQVDANIAQMLQPA